DYDGKILNITGVQVLETDKLIQIKGLTSIKDLEPFAKKFKKSLTEIRMLFPEKSLEVQSLGLFEIQCKINNQLLIVWGTEENVEEKIKILQAIKPVIKEQWAKVAYLDVRSPKNLAIRYLPR
ncbi:MAG: cell division protein FtsQ/DivIB, partial [Candidatus Margulisbacteria bacterium]|nr:cell division protein FtsQ/DivIB [Candidatus Margulisiibacteriota bacterium]